MIPISLTENWDLISRTIIPTIRQEDVVPDETQNGMGDILQSLFFSPAAPIGPWIIGAGPAFLLPTATTHFLGAEKFSLGPTVVVLQQRGGWTLQPKKGQNDENQLQTKPPRRRARGHAGTCNCNDRRTSPGS